MNTIQLQAGSAVSDITPNSSQFLYGYPRVPRMSTGVHDRLLSSALYLEAGEQKCLFIANDIIAIDKPTTAAVRKRVSKETGVPAENILVSCSHTHSGPVSIETLVASADPVVPKVDQAYTRYWEDGMVRAAVDAWKSRRAATLSSAIADATGIGTNRHDPRGPSDLKVPVLIAREAASGDTASSDTASGKPIAVMLVCGMHPTVLHEDSKLISGDFPADARAYLQKHVVGKDCPIVYHIGAAGDQSPRHVTKANTFVEAERLGQILGRAVEKAIKEAKPIADPRIAVKQAHIDLPMRSFPELADAEKIQVAATGRFETLRAGHAPRTETRTAECDMFGADETVVLARAADDGRLQAFTSASLPAEVQVIAVGPLRFVGWPGELFVEFALRVREKFPAAATITLANGGLQGYAVTREAVDKGWYEAGNAVLKSPDSGDRIVEATLKLLEEMG